jgi:hypothetical protein
MTRVGEFDRELRLDARRPFAKDNDARRGPDILRQIERVTPILTEMEIVGLRAVMV